MLINGVVINLLKIFNLMYSIQHYVIKFVIDLRQVSGFNIAEIGFKHNKSNQSNQVNG
jgi:hypothetical protein